MTTLSIHGLPLFRSAATLLLLVGAAACAPVITGGGSGEGGAGQGGGTGTGTATGPGVSRSAIAILAGQMGGGVQPGPGSGGAGGGTAVDPSTLYVQIANYAESCGSQFPYACDGGTRWQVSIGIPPALQVPGVLELSNSALISTANEAGSDGSGPDGSCWGGGGSFLDGTIEIVSIDQSTVVVRLAGTSLDLPSSNETADGEYWATRCPWLE